MNYFKRAMLSVRKHKFKTGLLFGIIFLLTSLTATALTMRQAMINTDRGLRAQLPPVVTLMSDEEKLLYYSEHHLPIGDSGHITAELIQEIGQLPYVRAFNFVQGILVYSTELMRVQPDEVVHIDLFNAESPYLPAGSVIDFLSLKNQGIDHLERFTLEGVYYHEMLDIQSGFLELVAGRTFLREEVTEGRPVVMVSQAFLEANHLTLGGTISLDLMAWRVENTHFTEEYLLLDERFEFEIVGVFDQELTYENENMRDFALQRHMDLMNQIYVPVTTLAPMREAEAEVIPEMGLSEAETEEILRQIDWVYDPIVFLLDDPVELVDFHEAAQDMIPYFWTFADLSNAYGDMSTAMVTIQEISDGLLAGAALSTVVSLGLLLLMILRERQHEIGIYLSLGEEKKRIFVQLLIEVVMISVVAVTCALLVGSFVSSRVTESMIQTELANQVAGVGEEGRHVHVWAGSPEALGFTHSMTHEDMLALYDATMSGESILIFYGVTLTTVLVATLVPIYITVNKNPKDLLILKDV